MDFKEMCDIITAHGIDYMELTENNLDSTQHGVTSNIKDIAGNAFVHLAVQISISPTPFKALLQA
eukprot:14647035-Ditylum_brightwellii.AAC.2